ncbi:MAG TPA: glycosyltransferase family 39 protein [Saprospiraceae bacterium]|nr:glycosyltransferase family 39 protein [Saprospiraceae bacterium]
MAKHSKDKVKSSAVRPKPVSGYRFQPIIQLGKSIVYGVLGSALFYLFNHILVFSPKVDQAYIIICTVLSGILAFVSSTSIFQKHIDKITYGGLAMILIQVLVTVGLTYSWIPATGIWTFLSSTFAIPLGIIWFFILRNKAISEPVNKDFVYPFKPLFQDNYLRILSIVVFLICGVMIFYRLGFYDIWEDENLVINAARGIQQQGLAFLKEGYDRVWMHSLLISWFFDLFGVSEFTGRLPSALFGLVSVLTCYYAYTRWYGNGLVAVMIPIVCLMNDRFLILFRYMRMYALLIPIFLLGVYILYRTVTIKNKTVFFRGKKIAYLSTKIIYIAASVVLLLLLAHLQKLAMIILPVFFIFISILVWYLKTKELKYFLLIAIAGGIILAFLSFGLELHSLRMFRQVSNAIFTKHGVYGEYYNYMLDNGLPINSTMMTLIGGLGLLRSRVSIGIKSILIISYLLLTISLVSMIYLIASEGQDYRYIAHIVPFVIGILLFTWYQSASMISKKTAFLWLFFILVVSFLSLKEDYKRVYVKHPWSPSYSVVYKTLKEKYRRGDAIFAQNMKTYYLDGEQLAGNLYHKVPGKKQYSLEEFKKDIGFAQRGWVVWDRHKVYHWRDDVITYIYENFKPYHGGPIDNLGVELWYFDEKMLNKKPPEE